MRALVFGAQGQVGRALTATAPCEVELVPLTRQSCDISDRFAVERAIGAAEAQIVVNAAGYTAVDRAEQEPEEAALANAAAPGWMAAAARAAGAMFVHLSTDFVFDGRAGRPYRPQDQPAPLSVYGRTKREGELAALAAAPAALILRTAWVYAQEGSNFPATILRLMRERERVSVVADQIGTPTWAHSLAEALWRLAGQKARGIHHFTDAGTASWYDFAHAIQEEALAAGLLDRACQIVPIRSEDYPAAAARPAFSVLDKTQTWALLGGAAPHWRVNLRRCLQAMVARGAP